MRVTVDREKCQGHGICHMLEPERFPLDDLGYSAMKDTRVAETDADPVRRVVASCPERALSVRS
jgi:ferredoxin